MGRGVTKRQIGFRKPKVYRYAIFSEGTVTEPSYFRGLKRAVEQSAIYRDMIYICGTGRSTKGVLAEAKAWIEKNGVKRCKVWCLYDKDDFEEDDFNNVVQSVSALNRADGNGNCFFAGWSNESFEYWLVLHFMFYQVNNGRQDYERLLDERFHAEFGHGYSKRRKDFASQGEAGHSLWDDMMEIGDPRAAVRHAERQLEQIRKREGAEVLEKSPCRAVPATKVHELVRDLMSYLPKGNVVASKKR